MQPTVNSTREDESNNPFLTVPPAANEEEEANNTEYTITELINDVKKFSKDLTMFKNNDDIEITFQGLNNVVNDIEKHDILNEFLKNTFNNNIDYIKKDFKELKKAEEYQESSNKLKETYSNNLEKLKNEINLYKRSYKYSIDDHTKMLYDINLLKYFLIFTLFLFAIPVLKLNDILDDNISKILYYLVLSIGIAVITYLYYTNNLSDGAFYDNIYFDKHKTTTKNNNNYNSDNLDNLDNLDNSDNLDSVDFPITTSNI
jgi:hypothetical protein